MRQAGTQHPCSLAKEACRVRELVPVTQGGDTARSQRSGSQVPGPTGPLEKKVANKEGQPGGDYSGAPDTAKDTSRPCTFSCVNKRAEPVAGSVSGAVTARFTCHPSKGRDPRSWSKNTKAQKNKYYLLN